MITKGKVVNIGRDLEGKFTITMSLEDVLLEDLKKYNDQILSVELKKWSKPKSKEANSYFHKLVSLLAKKTRVSNARMKNEMIGLYGVPEIVDGMIFEFDSELDPDKWADLETPHTVWTNAREEDGRIIYTYRVQKGVRYYTSDEISALIEGTVQEAKKEGIETLPPDEIAAMEAAWKGCRYE